ncbi:hypothetical protein ACTHQ6_09320 [Arthrobacter sp. SAFR-179]|uniref:hypothetical protein n=1 Tax=Arthrobacter sp. SAFR-179 TaxID=3387279 RepID=UPI003F7C37BC
MEIESKALQTKNPSTASVAVDISLRSTPPPGETLIAIDRLLVAVDGVHPYVNSRLRRIGRSCDVEDVLQEIRVAVWDGVAKGRYRELPGIPFEAWVQGVCNKICAAHIRRELAHQTLPLLVDFTAAEGSPEVLAVIGFSALSGSAEGCIDQAWAHSMLDLVHRSVTEETWKLAISSLVSPRHYGPPSPQDRRRWHAVTVVRQTAKTLNAALNCHPEAGVGLDGLCRLAANCLPSKVLRRVAMSIVRPGLRGPERSAQMAALASELGVSERYIAVNIGFARQLYRAAWRVIQHEAHVPAV